MYIYIYIYIYILLTKPLQTLQHAAEPLLKNADSAIPVILCHPLCAQQSGAKPSKPQPMRSSTSAADLTTLVDLLSLADGGPGSAITQAGWTSQCSVSLACPAPLEPLVSLDGFHFICIDVYILCIDRCIDVSGVTR